MVNDFHFCVTKIQINTVADDNQLHFSHACPSTRVHTLLPWTIEAMINDDLQKTLVWPCMALVSLKANPKKFETFGLATCKSPVDSRSKWQIQNLNKKTVLNYLELQCRSKGNISGGARERRRREPLERSGGMLPQKILKSRGLEMPFPAFSKSYL